MKEVSSAEVAVGEYVAPGSVGVCTPEGCRIVWVAVNGTVGENVGRIFVPPTHPVTWTTGSRLIVYSVPATPESSASLASSVCSAWRSNVPVIRAVSPLNGVGRSSTKRLCNDGLPVSTASSATVPCTAWVSFELKRYEKPTSIRLKYFRSSGCPVRAVPLGYQTEG